MRERVVQDGWELRDVFGLISHEIDVTPEPPVTNVSIHSWRHLADLHRVRAEDGRLNERRRAEVGAALEGFTGALAAEYPLLPGSG